MKNKLFTILFLFISISVAQAQSLNVHKTDGSIINVELSDIDSITFKIGDLILYEPFNGNTLNSEIWDIYDNTSYHESGLNMSVNEMLIINRGSNNNNNGWYGIISKNEYTNVIEASVDIWFSSLHNWQDHKAHFASPIGNMGYYNYGSYWWVRYADKTGTVKIEHFGNSYEADHKYTFKITDTGNQLIFEWDDGSGFIEVFSTSDYSSDLHGKNTDFDKKVALITSDKGYTKFDNLILK